MRGEAEPRLAEGGREGRGIQGKWAQTQGLGAGLRQARDRGHRDRLWGDPDKDRDWQGHGHGGQGPGQAGTLPQARGTGSRTRTIRVTSQSRGNQDKRGRSPGQRTLDPGQAGTQPGTRGTGTGTSRDTAPGQGTPELGQDQERDQQESGHSPSRVPVPPSRTHRTARSTK